MHRFAQTKIVATIGPASESEERIADLIDAGVSVFRLNFSHGERATHERVYRDIRRLAEAAARPIAVLQDLQGPKLRIGTMAPGGPHVLRREDTLRICTRPVQGTTELVSTTYEELARDVEIGQPVLIDDGNIRLEVTAIEPATEHGGLVTARVVHGGELSDNKGINLPQTKVASPALTDKDREDLVFGVGLGVDYIALSFVRSAEDIRLGKEAIAAAGGDQPLIAKIEKPQAVACLEEIVAAADGVMVARGDLGVELSVEAVPAIQKRLIQLANRAGKPVITATQMLESMIHKPVPTRAEASDVANAILDGTDAVMLSGETAVGAHPVLAVQTMARIAHATERQPRVHAPERATRGAQSDLPIEVRAIAHAARALADELDAHAIVVLTDSGRTAMRISNERPQGSIIAITDKPKVSRLLALYRGVQPVMFGLSHSIDRMVTRTDAILLQHDLADAGDRVVIVGVNLSTRDVSSMFLEIHTVSEQ